MEYNARRALELLRLSTGQPDAEFREGQEAAIRHIVEGRGRLLVVQKTGWGKSFVYFIATKLLREAEAGPALLISPLLALMRNQVAAAERMGVRACRITSDNQEDWPVAEERLRRDEVDILLISPERLGNEHFRTEVLADVSARIALLVIDEAHCISDWGHDFRPHYRLIERIARSLPANLRLLATTATANNRVMEDLRAVLGPNLEVNQGDLSFVIHYQAPGSVVAYYQQVGRAGRALDAAYGVLLSGEEETDITGFFVDHAFPTREEVGQIIGALDAFPQGLTVPELLGEVNVSKRRIEKTIALLSLESPAPIAKEGPRWQLTATNLSDEFWGRADRLTRLRRDEQRQMQQYVTLETGHMEFLIRALDGEPGAVQPPDHAPLPAEAAPEILHDAVMFLRRTSLPIAPRKQWPGGGLPQYGLRGKIAEGHRAEDGRALCIWRDSGWGELVRRGKNLDGRFADDLVRACVELVERWAPNPAPGWVTCIPSRRRPGLVPDFARRLAEQMALPFLPLLEAVKDTAEQKSMENSTQQARNVDGVFAVSRTPLADPVLLVDDLVDSRWTLTVAAWLLRAGGSGVVWPLSLASAGQD